MWACGKLAAEQFSNAWTQGVHAICENTCVVVGLDDVRTEVFGGSCDRKCLDLTMQPGEL